MGPTTRDFIRRNIVPILGIAALMFTVIVVLVSLLIAARELQQRTLASVDRTVIDAKDLLGPQNQIGKRSQREIEVLLGTLPYVLGGYVFKTTYGKTENPIIFITSKDRDLEKALQKLIELQVSGKGLSSAENEATVSLRNSQEAKEGLVKCSSFVWSSISRQVPELSKLVKGICLAPVPPFAENANLAIVVLLASDASKVTTEVMAVRKVLLQLQIDLFNREFQGRETWVHQ